MKKNEIIKTIIIIVVSVILSSGISVYATSTYLYYSCDVNYDNTSSGLNASNVQSSLDELYMHATDYTEIKEEITNIKSQIFPVGSIYISVTDDTVVKVQNRFGGTWEKFGEGKTLVGVNTSESEFNSVLKTGGEKSHTLIPRELPQRVIMQGRNESGTQKQISGYSWITSTAANGSGFISSNYDLAKNGLVVWDESTINYGGQSHNNLQPYVTVYMYKRVS